jgi:structural maintenance of chromosome 1
MTLTRKIEGLQGSLQDIRNKLNESEQPYQQANAALEQMAATIKQLESTIAVIEDEVFAEFCSHIGVANIREYEAVQFSLSEEVTDRRDQFASQYSRLEAQLSFEKGQLDALAERLRKLERIQGNDTTTKSQIETELAGMSGKDATLKTKLEKSESSLKEQTELEEQKQLEINDIRRSLEAKGKDVDAFMKEVTKVETEIEKIRAERISIFRKCKLEGIELPLVRGSMEDILVEDANTQTSIQDGNSMDLDEHPSMLSVQSTDWEVEVNYSKLGEDQKNDGSLAVDRAFLDSIKEMNDKISQMAPNLKAEQRLESVEERLRETEEAAAEARRDAKNAKEAFNTIKQKR